MLLKCEMDVVIGCRNVSAGEEAVKKIREEGIEGGNVKIHQLDMESMASVKKFASKVVEEYPKVHVLINNAGIMLVPYKLITNNDTPPMESHFAVNYAGHFLLTHLLMPSLTAAGKDGPEYARVVNVSSIAHLCSDIDFEDIKSEKCYIPSAAYGQSKLAQILFTTYCEKLFQNAEMPIHMYSVHPGVCDTDLFEGTYIKKAAPWFLRFFFKSPKRGAYSIMFPAVSPKAESLGGSYMSNCRPLKPSANARDETRAKKLFAYTCELLGIEHFLHPVV
ncbi:hypothetical protein J437_LFUL009051 [Ladona fulva]|uniref:Uncharacterized protein n=1 Tax=Ladona fulva TaxID=123851 RepID=A0A8K0JZN7_LADFU|nr:hypothetical protein J437_LFUL009051 [Ladona fulva]